MSGFTDKNEFAVAVLVNESRNVQGWNILSVKEVQLISQAWLRQLDRHGVPPAHYREILDRAIDRRIFHLAKNENAPMLSVELLLAMFRELKTDLHEKAEAMRRDNRNDEGTLAFLNDDGILVNGRVAAAEKYARKHALDFNSLAAVKEYLQRRIQAFPKRLEVFWSENHLPNEGKCQN